MAFSNVHYVSIYQTVTSLTYVFVLLAFRPRGLVGWRHSLKAVTPSDTSRFADGDNFVVAGIPVARDVAVMEAGLDVATGKNSTLGIHYAGQLGSGTSDNGVRVMYGMQF